MTGSPYVYTVLRYMHDRGTSEFLNAGVVVASCDAPRIAAKFKTTCNRIQGAFPSLDTEVFLARMKRLQECFDGIDVARCLELHTREGPSIAAWIRCVLPVEDRALHWSPAGNCAGDSLLATLQSLYERCVIRHDKEYA
ncbi:hypothetical protein SRS16CHR_00612 [Variovorax sp. SRS16]|nr:hypothetical protein SRS16CHR_00612 [Variovorax sp. SRS16]